MKSDRAPRLIRDQKVAVLYSPGYGAGWSTWCTDPGLRRQMLFDPQIADLLTSEDPDRLAKVEEIALLKYPEQYLGGLDRLSVTWIPEGTMFRVVEYDGSETIELRDTTDWIVA